MKKMIFKKTVEVLGIKSTYTVYNYLPNLIYSVNRTCLKISVLCLNSNQVNAWNMMRKLKFSMIMFFDEKFTVYNLLVNDVEDINSQTMFHMAAKWGGA